ncbi:MAG: MarR family transcriptional regulator [Burkholderiaceae bacterium]|nr:MarR family transcriptional regulator [Burkholderiaceae bacterium]
MTPTRFVDGYLGYLLGQANHALFKGFEPAVRAAGLTSIEWRVLATLHDSAPLTVSALAHEVLSKQPTVTKLVQRMREQGWVTLQADAADQRCTRVAITVSGRRTVKPLLEQAKALEAISIRSFTASEMEALKRLLDKLARQP